MKLKGNLAQARLARNYLLYSGVLGKDESCLKTALYGNSINAPQSLIGKMPDKYFSPGQSRAAKVDQLFTSIARRYDLINDIQSFGLHRYWKRRVVHLADLHPGDTALDVCCGTGDLAFALGRHGAETIGLDFNSEMLQAAKKRVSESNTHGPGMLPRFVQGDALNLPFPENSFDVVTIGYGLRNLASWEAGLREMYRVTKPGGRLLVLEFGKPGNPLLQNLYFAYLKLLVPVLGRVVAGNGAAYAYILESLKEYPGQNGVAAKMAALGLRNVEIVNFCGGTMSIIRASK
jgi:demethylmenaquinone methyltransferase/2-methoxy-6-polyprenyl-1,4-benzoquinol methylase